MSSTPKVRSTRSNSNNNTNITLNDIHHLINTCKNEMLSTIKTEVQKVHDLLISLSARIDGQEGEMAAVKSKHLSHDCEIKDIKDNLSKKPSLQSMSSEELCKEAKSRMNKSNALILSGLPEPSQGDIEHYS